MLAADAAGPSTRCGGEVSQEVAARMGISLLPKNTSGVPPSLPQLTLFDRPPFFCHGKRVLRRAESPISSSGLADRAVLYVQQTGGRAEQAGEKHKAGNGEFSTEIVPIS